MKHDLIRNVIFKTIFLLSITLILICNNAVIAEANQKPPNPKFYEPIQIEPYDKLIGAENNNTEVPEEINAETSIVQINDSGLKSAICNELGKPFGDVSKEEILSLTELYSIGDYDISDLTGLEYATNLHILDLSQNEITNLSPLGNLTQLNRLSLYKNKITDISPLSNLTQLETLDLTKNQITDLSSLSNMSQLKYLFLRYNQVTDLSSLSNKSNLIYIDLRDNKISDLSPLNSLAQVEVIYLSNNQITDISALSKLNTLEALTIASNSINDISHLSNLANLDYLDLDDNQLSDISHLSKLIKLLNLYLNNNQIIDISALSNLTNIQHLYLNGNQIVSISALVSNSGLGQYDSVELEDNPLNDQALIDIGTLEKRGVMVEYPHAYKPRMEPIGGAVIIGTKVTIITATSNAKVYFTMDETTPTRSSTLYSNPITVNESVTIKAFATADGMADSYIATEKYTTQVSTPVSKPQPGQVSVGTLVTLSCATPDARIYYTIDEITPTTSSKLYTESITINEAMTIKAIAVKAGMTDSSVMSVSYTIDQTPVINIPDPNLLAAVRSALNKPSGDITSANMLSLAELSACSRNINNLSGLEYAANLRELTLSDNKISDISVLSTLTNLTDLYLENNQIIDISALRNLINLSSIILMHNQITDITALVQNSGVGESDSLSLNANPLGNQAKADVQTLLDRGVNVYWDKPQVDECFIATAAFGSKLEPHVVLLRQFRDKYLLTNQMGRAFVHFYYRNSPPIAGYIKQNEALKWTVRVLLIPVIAAAYSIMHPGVGMLCVFILMMILFIRKQKRKLVRV